MSFFKKSSHNSFLIILIVFCFNLIGKSYYLANNDIGMDEPFTLFHSQQSVKHIFNILKEENNPPFHFLIVHFWIKIFGMSPFSVRFSSVLFSSICAVVIFLIGKISFSKSVGFFSSIIYSLSTLHIYYSHEVRVYSLFCMLYSLSLFFYIKNFKGDSGNKNFLFLFVCNCILLYSHYLGFWLIVVELVCLILISDKQLLKKYLVMFIALIISFSPLLYIFLQRLKTTSSNGTWVSKPIFSHIYGNINYFFNDRIVTSIILLVAFIFLTQLILYKNYKKYMVDLSNNKLYLILFIWFFIPYILSFVFSFKLSIFTQRYLIFTSIPLYILSTALLFSFFKNKLLNYTLAGLISVVMLHFSNFNPSNNRNIKDLAKYLKSVKDDVTIVYIAPDYSILALLYHYNIKLFLDYDNMNKNLEKEKLIPIYSHEKLNLGSLDKRLIYVQADYQYQDPENKILKTLQANYGDYKTRKYFPEIYNVFIFENK